MSDGALPQTPLEELTADYLAGYELHRRGKERGY